jgi:uncharacterized protein
VNVSCGRCRTVGLVLAGIAGLVFGVGLSVSGMTDPAKVIGFLDPVSGWDPSLMFVMGGGVIVNAVAYRWIRSRRTDPWFDLQFHVPTRRDIDPQLVTGAAIFGVGWGLGGLCPGPGIVAAASGSWSGILFVIAMLVGMAAHHRVGARR